MTSCGSAIQLFFRMSSPALDPKILPPPDARKEYIFMGREFIFEGLQIFKQFLWQIKGLLREDYALSLDMALLYLAMFLGRYANYKGFSREEAVYDLMLQLVDLREMKEFEEIDLPLIRDLVDKLQQSDTNCIYADMEIKAAKDKAESPEEPVVELDLTLDADDDVPLIRPKKRVLPLPLREPSLKEKERAAKSIGSLFVQTGGKRGFQLKHTLLPTGSGPWAQICRDQALIWTGRLQAGVEAGTITDKQYDGHQITPEEWNMGGSTPFLSLKLGPDRRSHYQTFSRKQRQRFKEALKGERVISTVVEPEEKSSNRDILEAELKGNGGKRKRATVIEDEPVISEKDEEDKHEVLHPDMELSDHEEQTASRDELIRMGRSSRVEEKVVDVWEGRCPECGGEKDELAQVCPTCMRAGHLPTQDLDLTQRIEELPDEVVEIAPLPFVLPAPVIPFTFKQKVHKKLEAMTKIVKQELESIPPDGDPHIISTTLLATVRVPAFWTQYGAAEYKGLRQDLSAHARATLLAVVQAAVFIMQTDEIIDDGIEIVKNTLSYDLMDLLGLLFWDKPIRPGWSLYQSAHEWDLLGIDPSKWEKIVEESELILCQNLTHFLLRATENWQGDELRPHATRGEIEELGQHVVLIARIRLLMGAVVQTLLVANLEAADLGIVGKKNLERQKAQLSNVDRIFQDLKQSRKKNPLTLGQQSFKVQTTFIDNLRKFLTNDK